MIGIFCFGIAVLVLVGAAKDDFDPTTLILNDDVTDALFPKTCPSGENWKNEKTAGVKVHCIYNKGHFGEELAQFANDADSLGCHVDRGIAKYMADNFGSSTYTSNPVYQRIGDDCGFCGVKASCCGMKNAEKVAKDLIAKHPEIEGADPFYFQTIKGLQCSDKSSQACSMKPLSSADFDTLAKIQPFTKNIDRSNDCNFAQFGFSEWESARSNPSFPVGAALYDKFLCRSTQTNRPKVTCIKNPTTKQCMCCCFSYTPVLSGGQYTCVQKNDKESETICSKV